MSTDEQHEANLRSPNVGVRWQAQMEDHLATVRERMLVISRLSVGDARGTEVVGAHAAVAQAAATAAVALAIANTGGDLEVSLSRVAEAIS
jgi:hypothetical protein